jgi:hypothetical protein
MWGRLGTTKAEIRAKFPELTTTDGVAKAISQSGTTSKYQQYFDLMNNISSAIHEVVDKGLSAVVRAQSI